MMMLYYQELAIVPILFVCCTVIANPSPELNVSEDRRLHRRRSIVHDPRYLDFKFVVEPKSAVIDESSHALFHCAYTINALDANLVKSSEEAAGADVRIEWRKDGTSVDHLRSSGRIQTLANGSLLIENAGPADEGIYQCAVHVNSALLIASTPWIFLSRRVTLQAPFFDRFDVQPADQSVFPQQKAAFRCLINSKPAAEIEWYKDNSRLKPIESQRILPVSQTLELSDVSKDDAGNYKCVARNGAKTRVSQIGALHVKEDVNEIAGTLSVVLEPRSQVLRAGDSFLLECLVNGFPLPKVTWSHDRVPIVIDARRQLVGRANSSLLVISAQLADAGSYTCRAENGEDIVDLAAAVSIRTMPKIVVAPRDEATQETLDAEFECVAEGVPKPRITWYKNGEVIIPSEYFVIASNRLKVFGLVKDDQGVYQCFAENDVGSAQASAQLLVDAADILSRYYALFGKDSNATVSLFSARLKELLSLSSHSNDTDTSHMALTAGVSGAAVAHQRHQAQQPLALKAVNVGSRAISLSWDPPPHSPTIQLYHVFFRMEDSTREKLVNSTTNYVTLSDLQPNTAYVIRIAGESNSGLGKASETIRVLTKREDAVPGRVRNLRGKVLGSETIQVDWDPPSASAGAEAFRYRLFYIKKGAAEDEHETQVLMVKTSYTLHSMEKYTMYNIRVEAEGASGVGPSSDVLELRTFADVPSASPKNVRLEALSPKTVRVRWSPPDIDQRNGEIIGYKIRYKTKRKGSKGNAIIVEGDPGMFIVEGLEPSAHYTFRIAAMTTNGTGIFSDWLGVDTPVEEREETQIAGAPSELRVHAGHDFIEVSWLPPRDDNIMIRGYLIGWGVNIPDIEKTSVDANVRHYTIKGLKPSREYVISLRAFNNIGNGFPIYETVQTAAHSYGRELFHQAEGEDVGDRRVPSRMLAPMGVVAEPVSSSSIRLMWTDPNDGFNQYYTVRYSSGDNNGNVRQFNTSETEVVVDGLKPNTQYEFAVRLVESSEWSLNAVNRTFASPPSSAPRDLSIFAAHPTVQDEEGTDAVTLSWQPPKYANGEIEEYIVLYSDKLELSDKDWIMDSVKGDRLSMTIHNLIPMLTYYFKIQARNIKGYGPLSPVATYTSRHYTSNDRFAQKGTRIGGVSNVHLPNEAFYTQLGEMLTSNFIYVLIGIVSVVLIFLIVVLAVVCIQRKGSNSPSPAGGAIIKHDYMEGRKYSSSTLSRHNTSQQPDLWIHQQLQQQNSGNRFALLNASSEGGPVEFIEVATPHGGAHDVKRFAVAQHLNATADSPPPRYQTLQEGLMTQSYHSQSPTYSTSPLIHGIATNVRRRHHQHRKSLPPRFSVSATLSASASPQSSTFFSQHSPSDDYSNTKPRNVAATVRQHRNLSGSARGGELNATVTKDDISLYGYVPSRNTPPLYVPINGNKAVASSSGVQSVPITAGSSFTGVGVPAFPLLSVAKRSLTAKMKPFAAVLGSSAATNLPTTSSSMTTSSSISNNKDNRVKTVNFSPEVSVNAVTPLYDDDDGFCWEKQATQLRESTSNGCIPFTGKDSDGGTLSRSYHQSSTSLEMARQKTPQILYTGVNRQPIAKVEFASSEHGSYAGSTTMLPSSTNTPPPSSSLNGCCGAPDSHDNSSSYQPLRTLNPLKSFAQMGGAPPPASSPFLSCTSDSHDQRKTAHIVRPVVVASPTLRNYNGNTASNGKPAGIVIGQKSTLTGKLPVGRATAQPRVDVSEGIHSPYSTVRGTPDFLNNNNIKCISGNGVSETNGNIRTDSYENRYNGSNEETKPLKSMPSSEDVDEIENYGIDRMIDTLQQLQQEFTER